MFPHEKPAPLGRQNWTPEILRDGEGGREGTHQREILVETWQINGAREGLWETKKKMEEEGKGKRHAPTETSWGWKGNESLIRVIHVYVSDQSHLFTH